MEWQRVSTLACRACKAPATGHLAGSRCALQSGEQVPHVFTPSSALPGSRSAMMCSSPCKAAPCTCEVQASTIIARGLRSSTAGSASSRDCIGSHHLSCDADKASRGGLCRSADQSSTPAATASLSRLLPRCCPDLPRTPVYTAGLATLLPNCRLEQLPALQPTCTAVLRRCDVRCYLMARPS